MPNQGLAMSIVVCVVYLFSQPDIWEVQNRYLVMTQARRRFSTSFPTMTPVT